VRDKEILAEVCVFNPGWSRNQICFQSLTRATRFRSLTHALESTGIRVRRFLLIISLSLYKHPHTLSLSLPLSLTRIRALPFALVPILSHCPSFSLFLCLCFILSCSLFLSRFLQKGVVVGSAAEAANIKAHDRLVSVDTVNITALTGIIMCCCGSGYSGVDVGVSEVWLKVWIWVWIWVQYEYWYIYINI